MTKMHYETQNLNTGVWDFYDSKGRFLGQVKLPDAVRKALLAEAKSELRRARL